MSHVCEEWPAVGKSALEVVLSLPPEGEAGLVEPVAHYVGLSKHLAMHLLMLREHEARGISNAWHWWRIADIYEELLTQRLRCTHCGVRSGPCRGPRSAGRKHRKAHNVRRLAARRLLDAYAEAMPREHPRPVRTSIAGPVEVSP